MNLVFVRHTSVNVPKGVCYGQSDVPLSDTFETEAADVKSKLNGIHVDKAYTSPLSRCRKLARYCGFGEAVVDDRLMEINFGQWEMMRYDDICDPRLKDWYEDFLNVAPTGGESAMTQRSRFICFLRSIDRADNHTIAVFTHGGILIHALVLLRGIPYEEAYRLNPGYGEVITFQGVENILSRL